ncbi:tripartite tricarboxylate transporter substrate binding protein [Ramlibacter henchirensis]|uniref:Tripartite tricarboxylate transporter substrate binding protein n=2 Tax=Ramlibacter henchirensis TaxID=204072 RepID=A0A4Z0C708_9BURK|nr:tripartite tricarboxylate transporter substrate binding protein [Ramlibacter henchirensis]
MLLACGTALGTFGSAAHAQSYPTRAIKLVIPYAVGGSTDQTGRLIALHLSQKLGQPVVVENRAGAGGSIGHELVAKSPADGHTLLFSAAGPLTVTPHTYAKLAYDPLKAFETITLVATQPLLLVVNPSLKVSSVAELVREANARSKKLSYGSFGNGSAAHLAGELFKTLTKVDMIHVPYKGSGPALVDLVSGQIDLMFDVFSTAAPLAKDGKLRPIAITSAERSPQFPNVPTMEQAGVAGFDAGTWFGVLAPAGTPRAIVEQLSKAMNSVLEEKSVRETLSTQGAIVRGGTPEQFQTFFLSEYDRWGRLVKAAGVTAD